MTHLHKHLSWYTVYLTSHTSSISNIFFSLYFLSFVCSFSERNNFDNPVYSLHGVSKRDNEQLLNNTNCMIRNNLQRPSNTLLERARLGQLGPAASCSNSGMLFYFYTSYTLKKKETSNW